MSYGVQDMALHLRLCAVLRYRGKLSISEIDELMPWELSSFIDVFDELSEEDKKQAEG